MTILILNPKTLEADILAIKDHIELYGPVIFSEVTNRKVTEQFTSYYATYFIDPQHTFSGQGGYANFETTAHYEGMINQPPSAIFYTYFSAHAEVDEFLQEYTKESRYVKAEVLYVLEKPDMDSVGTVALLNLLNKREDKLTQENPVDYPIEVENRIIDIHNVDCHIMPTEWNPKHIQSFEVKWTNILGCAVSDFKIPIEKRVSIMEDFLLNGNLPEQYRSQVEQEWKLLQEATVETLSGITVVTSAARGVSGLIYKQSPFGIAYCENFMGKGAKFSVMEFQSKYLNLTGFFEHMNANFPEESGTWGGNIKAGIGGSPIPCSLSKETVAAELAKFVL